MSFYTPTYVKAYKTGLVQSRQNFILPSDAYPILENAFVFRERILRKSGYKLLGRLRRVLTGQALGNLAAGAFNGNIRTILFATETQAEIEVGSLTVDDGVNTFTDNGDGTLTGAPGGSGTINYSTMQLTITGGNGAAAITADFNYFPGLPVMGLPSQELAGINTERLVSFDTKYAYRYVSGFQEYIPGTTWSGNNSDFFWATNYWVSSANLKVFWVTNFSGTTGDPIRYTSGTAWIDFSPQIDSAGNVLAQCLAMTPFKGRMMTFNTYEGMALGTSTNYPQRIRWAAIGNPFTTASAIVSAVNANAWRDDIPGQGGFIDIPTTQNIVSIGFVRDNLVVFCERSSWQVRHTERAIAPFKVERVNDELGAESTFSSIQFDTSLVGVGDKGIVECDSYKSDRIDIKIPDLTLSFSNSNNALKRVHGIRDFQQRLAYWTYVSSEDFTFPDSRLVYNYEDDCWSIFKDSFTTLGTFQDTSSLTWADYPADPENQNTWQNQTYPWTNRPAQFPAIIGGNQQGFVEKLGQYGFENNASNDISLSIKAITGNVTTPTVIECTSNNLIDGSVIEIHAIPDGTPFDNLNEKVFGVIKDPSNSNLFELWIYDAATDAFTTPQLDAADTYIGGGRIAIRDNFRIVSKKFNFLDNGQSIQFGHMDILTNATDTGAFSMKVYVDYNDSQAQNILPQNNFDGSADTFFNSVIPTSVQTEKGSSKNFQRVYCNTRGSFITIEFTLSNAQMIGDEQEQEVQIDAQVLYMRPAGKQLAAF